MRKYTEYQIMNASAHDALVSVKWFVKDHPDQCIILHHHVPPQAETEKWSEERLVKFWLKSVPDVPRLPFWVVTALKAKRLQGAGE
jgi:hypothetical protein